MMIIMIIIIIVIIIKHVIQWDEKDAWGRYQG